MLGGLIAAGAIATVTLTSAHELRLASRNLRLGDVATVSGPEAGGLRALTIARLPQGVAVRLSRAELAALVRRAMPGARVVGDLGGALTLRSVAPITRHPKSPTYVAEAPVIARGQALTLTATMGSAVIERPVVALQNARKGDKRLFVGTGDGAVLSAPLQMGAAQ